MDRRQITKFKPHMFLTHPSIRKADASFEPKTYKPFWEKYMELPLSVKDTNDGALATMIKNKAKAVDTEFGSGAGDWLMNNMGSFEADERLKLYYMLEGLSLPANYINPDKPKPSGQHNPSRDELIRTKPERSSEVGKRG